MANTIVNVRQVSNTNLNLRSAVNSVTGRVFDFFSLIIGFAAVFYLILSGIKYIASQGDPARIKAARAGIISAITGIIIITAAYAIIRVGVGASQALNSTVNNGGAVQDKPLASSAPEATFAPGPSLVRYLEIASDTLSRYEYDETTTKFCYAWQNPSAHPAQCLDALYFYGLNTCIQNISSTTGNKGEVGNCLQQVGNSNHDEWICRAWREDHPSGDCPINNE